MLIWMVFNIVAPFKFDSYPFAFHNLMLSYIAALKSSPEFENFTDEMAEETVTSLEALGILIY